MIFDKILFDKLPAIGEYFIEKTNLEKSPKNVSEMNKFLLEIKNSINNSDFGGCLLGNILFSFVSDAKVRDRNTSARTFEDIFAKLFGETPEDENFKSSPNFKESIPPYLIKYINMKSQGFSIIDDLNANRRKKTDILIRDYPISMKTQKGVAYDKQGNVINEYLSDGHQKNKQNDEINVGSFSYRALLVGLLDEDNYKSIGDRKKGLGSASQIKENILLPIERKGKKNEFCERLKDFLDYVYCDDLYVVFKGNFKITFYLIPNTSFKDALVKKASNEYHSFNRIFNRWESNNLRLNFPNLLKTMNEYKLSYYKVEIMLTNAVENEKIKAMESKFFSDLSSWIDKEMSQL